MTDRLTFTRNGTRVIVRKDRDHVAYVLDVRRQLADAGFMIPDRPARALGLELAA